MDQHSVPHACTQDLLLTDDSMIGVSDWCPDAPFTVTKLLDSLHAPTLLAPGTPSQQVPELPPEMTLLPQVPISDQVQQIIGDQALLGLPLGSEMPWLPHHTSQAMQETHVDLQLPQPPQLEAAQAVPQHCPAEPKGKAARRPGSSQKGGGRARRPTQSKALKLYERDKFDDPVKEKRRLDAINSKNNRVRKAKELAELRQKVDDYTRQRDLLEREVQALRQREMELMLQLGGRPHLLPPSLSPPSSQLSVTPSPPPYHAHHLSLTPPPTPHFPLTPPPNAQ